MSAYLVDHPPARTQYRRGRRATPTGTIVLHTAENTADLLGPDAGAENIARFISTRTDAPGSYHLIGDRDSQVQLVPFEWEAFHDGTGSNPWSIGISLAVTAAWFRQAPDDQKLWYMARLATMARTASAWLTATHGLTVPARRLTKATRSQAGFCTHMDRENWEGDPGRRSDPWGNSDDMWHLFLTLYADTATTGDEIDMATIEELKGAVRSVLNEGKGKGQTDWAGTSAKTLAVVQTNYNLLNAITGMNRRMILSLADALQAEGVTGITETQVEAAMKRVFADAGD